MKNRVVYLDLLRVIAIYFVIVIHTNTTQTPPSVFDTVVKILITTCVPLFVMVSGAVLLGKKETTGVFLKKRVIKILFPWIVWTIIYMGWQYFVNHYPVTTRSDLQYFFERTFFTQLWFLPMIFGLYLLTPLFRFFVQSARMRDIFYVIMLWFITLSFLPVVHAGVTFPSFENGGLVGQVITYSGYFLLGYFLSRITLTKQVIGLVTIFLAGMLVGSSEVISFVSPLIVATTIFIFVVIRKMMEQREKHFPHKLSMSISTLGRAAFGVYLVHQLVLWSLAPQLPAGFVLGFVVFILSFVVVYFMQRIPVFKYLLPA